MKLMNDKMNMVREVYRIYRIETSFKLIKGPVAKNFVVPNNSHNTSTDHGFSNMREFSDSLIFYPYLYILFEIMISISHAKL